MSNPRKFSEKIAMHAQKQAEGTAAFEAILKEVSATTKAALAKKITNFQTPFTTTSQPSFSSTTADQHIYRLPVAGSQYLADQRSSVVYRGRSLPNVNQMASHKPIDLQKALSSLENMKHEAMGRSTSTSGRCIEKLFPRGQMERSSSQPRKHFSLTRHRDCSPYGSVYLSPPNDQSWRRVSSDSAIHSNVLGNQSHCGSKIILNTDHGSSDNITVSFAGFQKQPSNTQFWQVPEDSVAGRPKSCDVPGINIFPSSEILNQGNVAIAIAMQQTPSTPSSGSLPNLNKNPNQAGGCNQAVEKEPCVDAIAQYYLQQSRLQRQTVPAPLVLRDSNFIVMDANSIVCDNTLLLSGQSHQNSPSLTNCQYSSNSPSFIITNENSPNQLTPNMNSQQLLQYQQQQLILQQYQLLQSDPSFQQKTPGIAPQSSGFQSIVTSLSSPMQVTTSTNHPHPLLQAVLTQGLNIQQLGSQHQVAQETDYGCFSFSPECAPKLNNQQPLKGHFFPIQNLNAKPSRHEPTHVILSSNVLAEAAAKQQAAVAAAVARSNSLTSGKGLSFANIMPVTDNPDSQKIFHNTHESQHSHTNVLQQKFQQISVGKNMSIDYTLDGITLQPLSPPLANFVLVQNNDLSNWIPRSFVASPNNNTSCKDIVMLDNELINDNTSASLLQQQTASNMRVIPDIIFTDFVGSSQERLYNPQQTPQQMPSPDDCKEALNALSYLSDTFEGEIFTSEDALKLALDPLEMEELQMLADSSVFTDPATEDSFRLDRP